MAVRVPRLEHPTSHHGWRRVVTGPRSNKKFCEGGAQKFLGACLRFSARPSLARRARIQQRESHGTQWVALVRPGTDEIAARNRQHVAALCETGNVFEMTAAQTRGDTIHARNLYAAEVRLTGAYEYVLLRLNVSDEEIWLRLGRENFASLIEYLNDEARWIKGH